MGISSCPLRRAGRWSSARRLQIDCGFLALLPASPRSEPRLPWQVHCGTQAAVAPGQASSMVRSRNSQHRSTSSVSCASSSRRTGSSMPSRRSVDRNMSSTTSPATLTAWRSPTIASSPSRMNASFLWKDYAAGSKQKIMAVTADKFLRRFLIHVLPGLVRIRYFGLFANRKRSASLLRCRFLLKIAAPPPLPTPTAQIKCPLCSELMLVVERITSHQLMSMPTISPSRPPLDSS